MKDLNLQVDQISPDAQMIIVRGDFRSFSSVDEAHSVAKQLHKSLDVLGKPVLFMDRSMSIEQISVEQLERLGFQRIDRGTS
ncbi:hypothetical protein [Acinetobacter ursingii]|uniref:hypothetical protein n=1 Tax=Acinetobacter ursingii TaxID=108980 RepID=UPI00124F803D|nr:hypothetical protein [Acinetobacter ursingii]MCU4496354.1 hypothetical protein [Acinetobacter ursingii]UYF78253.1 hypothetical protein LSO59_12555 [Acinetobacter ursingii]